MPVNWETDGQKKEGQTMTLIHLFVILTVLYPLSLGLTEYIRNHQKSKA